jgi:hypothetical protein
VIRRLINQALAGLNYILTLVVSVIVVIIAIVLFRDLVAESDDPITTTTTTTSAPAAAPVAVDEPLAEDPLPVFACRRASSSPDAGSRVVRLFYACGAALEPAGNTWVYREIPGEGDILLLTMQQLAAGPTPAERNDGFRSVFSVATSDAVITVERDASDVVVDLRDLGPLPSLRVGSGGLFFLAALNNTVFQHEDIDTIEYRVEGSCEAFWAYFGSTDCLLIGRALWETDPGAAAGSA